MKTRSRAFAMLLPVVTFLATAYVLFALAARWFVGGLPSFGAAAGAVTVWTLRATPSDTGVVSPAADLAVRAGVPGAVLVLGAALNSAFLIVIACAIACGIGIPLGFWLAVHAPPRLVALVASLTTLGVALPAFFVTFLLQLGAVELAGRTGRTLLPVYGYGVDTHLVIPVIALSLAPVTTIARLVLVSASELDARDFVRTARAKGLPERLVIYRHIAPNMVGAIGEAALSGVRLVLGGLVIVEYLIVWPGLGVLALRALNVQDLGIFLGSVAVLGALFMATELGLDRVTRRTGITTG